MILTLDSVDWITRCWPGNLNKWDKQFSAQCWKKNEKKSRQKEEEKKRVVFDKSAFVEFACISWRRTMVRWFISWSELTSCPSDWAADTEADESRPCLSVPTLLLLLAAAQKKKSIFSCKVQKKSSQRFSVHKFEALVWLLPDEPMEMLCFSLSVLTTVAAGDWRTFLESLILPSVGSRPKYFTCSRTSRDDVNAWRYIWGGQGGRGAEFTSWFTVPVSAVPPPNLKHSDVWSTREWTKRY